MSVWFALHVFFAQVGTVPNLALPVPDLATLNIWALILSGLAMVLMLVARVKLLPTLGLMALAGCGLSLIGFT